MIHVGILSDTHLNNCPDFFRRQVETIFAQCSIILNAGDLADKDKALQATIYQVPNQP